MHHENLTKRGEKMDFSRVKPKKEEDDVSIYEAQWTSIGIEINKRNTRKEMPIVLEVNPAAFLHRIFSPMNSLTPSLALRKLGQAKRAESFDNGVTMKTNIQVKFYPAEETEHSKWGQEMHALELSCAIPDGHIYVDIKKEKIY
ncbi:hypothetical protein C0Q70_13374 [Pomacea canaliculata]|uniref:CB1 cannabinoid receptor-interacting protein 1 n=1 Tax=Pomacea canaliculata TaxID=400727 RepID=A0A2T7NX31_POMCA|nr:hypothetical protein C0Q70_13374 [Pomacea canaliculata]